MIMRLIHQKKQTNNGVIYYCNLQELSAMLYFVMGALAKMAATFVTYPIQLVQSRLRVFLFIFWSIFLKIQIRLKLQYVEYLCSNQFCCSWFV